MRQASYAPATSTNETINRAFREPFFRFLLFLAALGRYWYWVLPLSLILGVVIAGGVLFLKKGTFTSEIWLRVHLEPRYVAFPTQRSPNEALIMVQTYLQFLYSPVVLNDAWLAIAEKAKAEGINIDFILKEKDPRNWLSRNINSRRQAEALVYVISVETEDARLSQLILESLMTSYFNFLDENSKHSNSYLINSLQEIADLKKNDIETLTNDFNKLSQQIAEQGGDLPSELQQQVIRTTQDSIANQIALLKSEMAAEDIQLRLNKNVLLDDPVIPDSEVEQQVLTDPMMAQLLRERVSLIAQMEEQRQKYVTDNSPTMLKFQKRLDDIEQQIERTRQELLPEFKQLWKATRYQEAHRNIIQIEKNIEMLKSRIASLQQSNRQQTELSGSVSATVNQAVDLLMRKNREEQVYTILLQRIGVLKTESVAQEQVEQISQAQQQPYPNFSVRNRSAGLGFLFGVAIPVLLAWGLELRSTRFYHMSQFPIMFPGVGLEKVVGLPRQGVVQKQLTLQQKRQLLYSIEEICNNLCFGPTFSDAQVFLTTSVKNDDGQAVLAESIAEKMAQMKKKPVLLIDTLGNNPRLRRILGVDAKGPLRDILSMRLSINDAVVRDSQQPNLYFLPDGQSDDDSPAELFSDGKFAMLLGELKKYYSAIIISARPLEQFSGSFVLCQHADVVLLAMRMNDTLRKNTEVTYERLGRVGTPVTSFLVSGVSAR